MPKPLSEGVQPEAVAVVRQDEQGIAQIAKDFGMAESCLRNWLHAADVKDGKRGGPKAQERKHEERGRFRGAGTTSLQEHRRDQDASSREGGSSPCVRRVGAGRRRSSAHRSSSPVGRHGPLRCALRLAHRCRGRK